MFTERIKRRLSYVVVLTLLVSLLQVVYLPQTALASGGQVRLRIVNIAYKQLGKSYRVGDEGPDSFDCSGLVWYCSRKAGVKFSRSSSAYYYSNYVDHISSAELWPGDLVFKKNTWRAGISHVGIYIGKGQVIEARGTAYGVVKTTLKSWTGSSNWAGAGRLKAKYWPDNDNSTNIPTPEYSSLTNRSFERWSRASYVANSFGCQVYGHPRGRYLKLSGGYRGKAAQSILTSSDRPSDYREVSQTVRMDGGSQAKISVWASSSGQSNRVWMWAIFLDRSGRTLKTKGVNGFQFGVNASRWRKMTIRTDVPNEASKVKIILRVQGQRRGSQTNWDDLRVYSIKTTNPSFEHWSNGPREADGYVYATAGNPGGKTFQLIGGHGGHSAQGVTTTSRNQADFRELSQDIAVPARISVKAAVWASSSGNPRKVWMWVTFKNARGQALKTVGVDGRQFNVNPLRWRRMSLRTSTPSGTTHATVMLRVQGQGPGTQTNFDDLSVSPW